MIKFIKNIHVIDHLKANLLIKMNTFDSKEVIINLFKKSIIFTRCQNISMLIQFTTRDNIRIRRIVRTKRKLTISSRSIKTIIFFFEKKNRYRIVIFFFEPQIKGVYFHFVNVEFNFVNVRNDNDLLFIISRYYKIESIMKYETKKVYLVNLKNYSLIAKSF